MKREEYSDADVIQHCSSGLALRGIFVNNEDCNTRYETVINLPSDVQLSAPSLHKTEKQIDFYLRSRRNKCTKNINYFGYSNLRPGGIGYYNPSVDDTDEKEEEGNPDEFYFGILKCYFVPTSSFTFNIDNITLTDQCIEYLIHLEDQINKESNEDKKQDLCQMFFDRFGSHVNIGPIHFGGIYQVVLDCKGNKNGETKIQDICVEVMNKFNELGITDELCVDMKMKCPVLRDVKFDIHCIGGQSNVIDFTIWEICLTGNKKTWCLIDLGEKKNLVGIWDLLQNSKHRFHDFLSLQSNLRNAWVIYCELKEEETKLLRRVKSYCDDPMFYKNCKQYLRNIVVSKNYIQNRTKSLQFWQIIFETPEMMELMTCVLYSLESFDPADIFYIKLHLTDLLHGIENNVTFEGKVDVIKWIENVPSLGTVDDKLISNVMSMFETDIQQNVLPTLERKEEDCIYDDKVNVQARVHLSYSAKYVIDTLKYSHDYNAASFIQLMILHLDYDLEFQVFNNHLTVDRVKMFLQRLTNESIKFYNYMKQDPDAVSFYLLQLALESAENKKSIPLKEDRFKYITRYIHFESKSKSVIESFVNKQISWEQLKACIRECIIRKDTKSRRENEDRMLLSMLEEKFVIKERSIDENLEDDNPKWEIFDELGLREFYPGQINLQYAQEFSKSQLEKTNDIPWVFLNNVLTLNYKGRDDFELPTTEIDDMDEIDILDIGVMIGIDNISCIDTQVYSRLDIVVAVFLCCDNLLKQLLAQKLYMSHISIPFILPDITGKLLIQLWTIRGIGFLADKTENEVVLQAYPIISFLRVTDLPQSKSKFVNNLLHESHDTFSLHESERNTMRRKISDGLVDAAWFISSIADKCTCRRGDECCCHLKETLMFLNLHGVCKSFRAQQDLLCKISTVVVILVDICNLNKSDVIQNIKEIVNDSRHVILLFTKDVRYPHSYFIEQYKDLMRELVEHKEKVHSISTFHVNNVPHNAENLDIKIRRTIILYINRFICGKYAQPKPLLEHFEGCNITNVKLDQDDMEWKRGQEEALNIYERMKDYNVKCVKNKVMPLQCDLWKEWARIQREIKSGTAKENENLQHFIARLYSIQRNIRDKQLSECEKESYIVIPMFYSKIINLKGNCRFYFIQWLTYFLKEVSHEMLPDLRRQYSIKKYNLNRNSTSSLEISREYASLKIDIENLENDIENVSINVKHFIREIGQFYEAVKSSTNAKPEVKNAVENLSRAVAELFFSGYILEILDSNAKQIPMLFIKSIFRHLKGMVYGKVFVISVLGIQSSGKSTLLNTMFGTQFPTNAGLCTKGVSAYLMPMPNDIDSNGYEYILIIDTKGMRGTDHEVETHLSDNEVATLAVGISDLTIFNMKGENESEMKDILQIVTHALLKIKVVNKGLQLRPKCFFTYQNVEAIDAKERLIDGHQDLVSTLNMVAVDVAREFGIRDITCFSDIIDFDVRTDIRYFSNLWIGCPPMAPINTRYSEMAREVKSIIFKEIVPTREYKLDITAFSSRLEDVWNGILAENFIFCFKNHLEINAYTSLENTFNQLKWKLNETGLTLLRGLKKQLNQSSHKKLKKKARRIIEELYINVNEDLANFFKTNNDGILLRERSIRYHKLLEDVKDDVIASTVKGISDEIDIQERNVECEKELIDWKRISRDLAIEIAEKNRLKGEILSAEELEEGFDKLWIELQTSIPSMDINEVDVEITVEDVLVNATREDFSLYQKESGSLRISPENPLDVFRVEYHHISIHNPNCLSRAKDITINIIEKVKTLMDEIKHDIFNKSHAEQAVKIVCEEIDVWNMKESENFELTRRYKVSMLVVVGQYITPFFTRMQEVYKSKVDIRSKLIKTQFKDELKTRYTSTFQQIGPEQTTATLFSQQLEILIKEEIDNELITHLPNNIKQNNRFMTSKKRFLIQRLKDLIKNESFEEYIRFVEYTTEYQSSCLRKYINEYLFESETFFTIAIDKVHQTLQKVLNNMNTIEEAISKSPPTEITNIVNWMEMFYQQMIALFPYIRETTKDLIDYSLENSFDAGMFHTFLTNSLHSVQDKLIKTFKDMEKLEPQVESVVLKQLIVDIQGCKKRCPFCKVTCSSAIDAHPPPCTSTQHYPLGISGCKLLQDNTLITESCNVLVDSPDKFRSDDTKELKVPFFRRIINFLMHFDSMYQYDVISFRGYKKLHTDWKIDYDRSLEASLYWKRILEKYKQEFATKYDAEVPAIPEAWGEITKEEAIVSLNQ